MNTLALTLMLLASFVCMGQDIPPKKLTLFTNVNVFDGTNDKLHMNMNVLVENNLIKTISKEGLMITASANNTIIDGEGMTLMPGLVDNHTHFNMAQSGGIHAIENSRWDEIGAIAASAAQEWLMDGFTTVRDMGGMGNGLKKTIDRGLLDGPRIYPSGSYVSQTSGHGDIIAGSFIDPQNSNYSRLNITQLADGADEVRKAVRKNIAEGATQIKIMVGGGISSEKGPLFAPQFTNEEIKAAVAEAATRETYVGVHVYQAAHIKRALNLGVKSIEHGQFIDREAAVLLKKKGAFLSPYFAAFSPAVMLHPVYGKKGTPQNTKMMEFIEQSKDFVDIIKEVQPNVVFAIDIVNLNGVMARKQRDHEKWIFAKKLGNFSALKAMTSTSGKLAQLTGRTNPYPGKFGLIEAGALADILIVDGNPLKDISVIGGNEKFLDAPDRTRGIKSIKLIMKDGEIYKNTLK